MTGLEALRLLVITDLDRLDAAGWLGRVAELAQAAAPGRVALELRDRSRPLSEMLSFGHRLSAIAKASGQPFIVNDRLDLAVLLDADGVHLGEGSVATADARLLIGDRFVIRACHRPDECADIDADIVLLSPILAARKDNPPLGLEGLETAARRLRERGGSARLFALGGVDTTGAKPCLSAGAHGVAAISAIVAEDGGKSLLHALAIERC